MVFTIVTATPSGVDGPVEFVAQSQFPSREVKGKEQADATSKLITNSFGMKLRLIPAGRFQMGSPEDEKDAEDGEKPLHEVTLTRPFYLGVYEVTQGEYEKVAGKNPSYFSEVGPSKDKVHGQATDRLPVEEVRWIQAIQVCNELSAKEGLKPFYKIDGDRATVPNWDGEGYRLPTEAEWEYACRAGTKTRYWFGDDPSELDRHAWYIESSQGRPHPVGERGTENPFGLSDMHGNVWEWCWDRFETNYYSNTSSHKYQMGPEVGEARVLRGGSWGFGAFRLRSANRNSFVPAARSNSQGFRLAKAYH